MTEAPRALLATDLDGTLLADDGSVSARTRAVLARARGSNVEVVFVTGRPPMFLPGVVADSGHVGTVICANGAVLLDAPTLQPRRVDAFASDHLREVLARMVATVPDGEYRAMMHRHGDSGVRLIGTGADYPDRVAEHLVAGWQTYKLAVTGTGGHSPDSFLALAVAAMGDLAEVTHSVTGVPLVEIGPPGVTKGSALTDYAAAVGVAPADVHAVGDMPNDLSMLAVAGRAYAVANGHPQVRASVHEVIPSNREDGVASLLEGLILQYR